MSAKLFLLILILVAGSIGHQYKQVKSAANDIVKKECPYDRSKH